MHNQTRWGVFATPHTNAVRLSGQRAGSRILAGEPHGLRAEKLVFQDRPPKLGEVRRKNTLLYYIDISIWQVFFEREVTHPGSNFSFLASDTKAEIYMKLYQSQSAYTLDKSTSN